MQSFFCRFRKISSGFCNHASLLTWGKKGINDVWCATWMVGGSSSPLWGSITGLHRLSRVNLGRVPAIIYNGGRECWPVLVWSKQETNGQKIPVIGSKVKVSIIPRAAVIQCWCSNPVGSSSWCCDPWSSGRAYGLVTRKGIHHFWHIEMYHIIICNFALFCIIRDSQH